MLYYVGKGAEFKKEDCREYKTLKNALIAASKDEAFKVWDETGQVIGSLVNADKVPEGALQTNSDGSINTYDESGNKNGTISTEEAAAVTGNDGENKTAEEAAAVTGNDGENKAAEEAAAVTGNDGENKAAEEAAAVNENDDENKTVEESAGIGSSDEKKPEETSKVIIPQGKMKVTVVCEGTLNLRRTPEWGNQNICGRASKGQSYYVKAIHTVENKKMVQTIDDIYLSGESDHVQFEKL